MARTKGSGASQAQPLTDSDPSALTSRIVSRLKKSLGSSAKDKGKGKAVEGSPSPSRPRKKVKSGALVIREESPQEDEDSSERRPHSAPLAKSVCIDPERVPELQKESHITILSRWNHGQIVTLISLFPDLDTLARYDILDPVRAALSKVGLKFLFEYKDPGTYYQLVREFLASFEPVRVDGGKGKISVSSWTFTMYGYRFAISTKKIIDWFDFPKHAKKVVLSSHERDIFWSMLVERNEYYVGNMSEQQIKSLQWKVIHRLVAENLVQRQETGRVTMEDLNFMSMIHHGQSINMIEVLTTSFESYRDNSAATAIGGGSFITLLAIKLNIHCLIHTCYGKILDKKKMLNLRMITKDKTVVVSRAIPPKASPSYNKRLKEEGPPSGLWMGEDEVPPAFEDDDARGDDIPHSSSTTREPVYSYDFSSLQNQMQELLISQRGFAEDIARLDRRQEKMFDFHRSEAAWQRATLTSLLDRFPKPPHGRPPSPFHYPPPTSTSPLPVYFEPGPSNVNAGVGRASSSTSDSDDPSAYVIALSANVEDEERLD